MNYLNLIPKELTIIIVSYINDYDDIIELDIKFNSYDWRILFHITFDFIDVDKCIPINWNYTSDSKSINLYYLSIYMKLLYAIKPAVIKVNSRINLRIPLYAVTNPELLMLKNDTEFNKIISALYYSSTVNYYNNINIVFEDENIYIIFKYTNDDNDTIGLKISRLFTIKKLYNLLVHVSYNSHDYGIKLRGTY